MREPVRRAAQVCPVEVAVAVAGGDWKLTVILKLAEGRLRFGELRRAVGGDVSVKTLTRQLRTLEEDGLVLRTVFPEVPPHVEYELTDLGHELVPVATAMQQWGERYLEQAAAVTNRAGGGSDGC